MKKLCMFITVLFLFAAVSQAVDYKKDKKKHFQHNYGFLDEFNIDIEKDGTLVIVPEFRNDITIEITDDYRLFVNGNPVKLNKHGQKLVKKYYDDFFHIIDEAKAIGLEGAKIGVEGAAIGVAAVAGVFKLLRSDYDSEDLEDEMDEKAAEIEKKAEVLEIKAEKLEQFVDEFEAVHEQLCKDIPEIAEYDLTH